MRFLSENKVHLLLLMCMRFKNHFNKLLAKDERDTNDEFDTTIAGPWMTRYSPIHPCIHHMHCSWHITHHNKHTAAHLKSTAEGRASACPEPRSLLLFTRGRPRPRIAIDACTCSIRSKSMR